MDDILKQLDLLGDVHVPLPSEAAEKKKKPKTSGKKKLRVRGKKAWQVSAVIIIVIPDFHPICEDVPVCMHGVYMLSCRLT